MTYPLVEMDGPKPTERRLARVLTVVTVLLLAFSVVGLVTIDEDRLGGGSSLAAVLAAADKTVSADTAKMAMSVVSSGPGVEMSASGVTMEGAVEFSGERRSTILTKALGRDFRAVSRGNTVYVQVPPGSGIPTPWASTTIDYDAAASPFASLSGPSMAGGGDPTATLRQLRTEGIVREVTTDGEAEVRGVNTTKYHVLLDPARYQEAVFAMPGLKDNPMFKSLEFKLTDPVMDVYIDGDGLLRRLVQTVNMSMAGLGQSVSISIESTLELYDFGAPVVVEYPPDSQVTKVGSMQELFEGSSVRPL